MNEPIKMAEWHWFDYYADDDYYSAYSCSNCGEISKEEEEYCPKCKAKMIKTIY